MYVYEYLDTFGDGKISFALGLRSASNRSSGKLLAVGDVRPNTSLFLAVYRYNLLLKVDKPHCIDLNIYIIAGLNIARLANAVQYCSFDCHSCHQSTKYLI